MIDFYLPFMYKLNDNYGLFTTERRKVMKPKNKGKEKTKKKKKKSKEKGRTKNKKAQAKLLGFLG